jgi:polysaccharide export outer membrane protein
MNRFLRFLLIAAFAVSSFFAANASYSQNVTPSYKIGPDDLLYIYVWKEPDLTQELVVAPDGNITFPLLGEIRVQGHTVTEVKEYMTEELRKYITAPEVTVTVRESRSRRIYVIGKVNSPGPQPLMVNMTVLQALSAAGGFAEWADEKNIVIVRKKGDKEIHIPFNYKKYVSGKNTRQNILLEPQDTIVVP